MKAQLEKYYKLIKELRESTCIPYLQKIRVWNFVDSLLKNYEPLNELEYE